MMTLAKDFTALHKKGDPLVLTNIWDVGSAQAVAAAGAKAIATGSWSVAAAQGYADGEQLPLERLLEVAAHIVASVDLPVSIDFEGAYASSPKDVARNVSALAATGTIGLNMEDRVVQGDGIYPLETQIERLSAVKDAAPDLHLNARTDLFLQNSDHAAQMAAAKERAVAYAALGADSFFAPGLSDLTLIAELVDACPIPLNVMRMDQSVSVETLAAVGVGRISAGPAPYRRMVARLAEEVAWA